VLAERAENDLLCFLVDLWSPAGDLPQNVDEVRTRQKDVTYAARSLRHIRDYQQRHNLLHKLRELYARLPADQRTDKDAAELAALGCDTTVHVVRLRYAGVDWHMASKDLNFSQGSLEWRWDQGYRDAMRALGQASWLAAVEEDTAVVVHDLPPRHR